MSNTELAKHIYFYSQNCKNEKQSDSLWDDLDDKQVINYIANLMELHFEPQNHLGSKGFISTSKKKDIVIKNSPNFGC
jgi:hypothetical protein